MNKEEIEAIEYFEHKIKNKLPLYEETYVDGKPYRRNILQLETNFTEEQADKTEILLNLIDKLQKENKKYIDIFNSTEKIMNGQERTKDKLLKENVELQKENEDMREELQMYVDTPINKLIVENEELKEDNRVLNEMVHGTRKVKIPYSTVFTTTDDFISKDIIRNKIKELEEEQKRKRHTPNFIGCANTTNYVNINNKREIKVLKELLGE